MSGSKHFEKIAWFVTAVMVVVTLIFMNGAALGLQAADRIFGYENRLFDQSKVHTIDIVMNDWDTFIGNATAEEYTDAALVIDGESFRHVAIRGKGNTSLSTVASLGSQRYSFKVEFDHYDSANTYHGLDKLSLNNLIQDSTMMKDYLTYTMMSAFGVEAPLCSFVYITVNGEDWGLYLAVEGIEDSFLERNYGADYGELYKPDSMNFGGGRGNGKNFEMSEFSIDPTEFSESERASGSERQMNPSSGTDAALPSPENRSNARGDKGRVGGNSAKGASDVRLQYIDDDPDSYSNIWNNAKTDIVDEDRQRLIASLKKLSQMQDIEAVVNTESVMRYFVVHNYVCNGDSYTGSMIHNYYLYEKDGQLSMLPWDYNLAFGTFQSNSAGDAVNMPIDSPVTGGSVENLPMLNWIFATDEYTQEYHALFAEFLSTVDVLQIIDNARALICEYVEKDPTAFYTAEEFETGVQALRTFCALRSKSISLQLENGETVENMQYVNADGLNLSDMGSMDGGRSRSRERTESFVGDDADPMVGSKQSATVLATGSMQFGGEAAGARPPMPDMENMPEEFSIPDQSALPQMPEEFAAAQMPEEFGGFGGMGNSAEGSVVSDSRAYALLAVSVCVLALGLLIAVKYKY